MMDFVTQFYVIWIMWHDFSYMISQVTWSHFQKQIAFRIIQFDDFPVRGNTFSSVKMAEISHVIYRNHVTRGQMMSHLMQVISRGRPLPKCGGHLILIFGQKYPAGNTRRGINYWLSIWIVESITWHHIYQARTFLSEFGRIWADMFEESADRDVSENLEHWSSRTDHLGPEFGHWIVLFEWSKNGRAFGPND